MDQKVGTRQGPNQEPDDFDSQIQCEELPLVAEYYEEDWRNSTEKPLTIHVEEMWNDKYRRFAIYPRNHRNHSLDFISRLYREDLMFI